MRIPGGKTKFARERITGERGPQRTKVDACQSCHGAYRSRMRKKRVAEERTYIKYAQLATVLEGFSQNKKGRAVWGASPEQVRSTLERRRSVIKEKAACAKVQRNLGPRVMGRETWRRAITVSRDGGTGRSPKKKTRRSVANNDRFGRSSARSRREQKER